MKGYRLKTKDDRLEHLSNYAHTMFTGIVQHLGTLSAIDPSPAGARLVVDRGGWSPQHAREVVLGDSICVSGVCLTVAEIDGTRLGFDVIGETLAVTKLGDLKAGDRVNLEPSVTPQQPMGGHFLQGHIDATGRVVEIQDQAEDWRATIQADDSADIVDLLVPKGSVAVDGVSLTIAAVPAAGRFTIALIPVTLRETTLGALAVGDRVNLETDIVARTVLQAMRRQRR